MQKGKSGAGNVMPVDPYLGQIMPFADSVVPRGWASCNGQLLSINTNPDLFAVLGTMFGGDGIRTFGLPDRRGRAIVGSSGGGNNPPGTTSGSADITLNVQ